MGIGRMKGEAGFVDLRKYFFSLFFPPSSTNCALRGEQELDGVGTRDGLGKKGWVRNEGLDYSKGWVLNNKWASCLAEWLLQEN